MIIVGTTSLPAIDRPTADHLDAVRLCQKRLRNPTFIGFTQVTRLDTILGKSPAIFYGGLLLVNFNHMDVQPSGNGFTQYSIYLVQGINLVESLSFINLFIPLLDFKAILRKQVRKIYINSCEFIFKNKTYISLLNFDR